MSKFIRRVMLGLWPFNFSMETGPLYGTKTVQIFLKNLVQIESIIS